MTEGRAKVILFKPSGKYYTEEDWAIPAGPASKKLLTGLFTPEDPAWR